jgi:hypothetical protein
LGVYDPLCLPYHYWTGHSQYVWSVWVAINPILNSSG